MKYYSNPAANRVARRSLAWAAILAATLPGLAASAVVITATNLNPAGASGSWASVSAQFQQAGAVRWTNSYDRAALWSGTPVSYVDLHPASATESAVLGSSGASQVGAVQTGTNFQHAALWSGTAASMVDLHPAGARESKAHAVSGARQAGFIMETNFSRYHAALWSGTAASMVDLHPVGAVESKAYGISGTQQVGYVTLSGNYNFRAVLWSGTAASCVDLHPTGAVASVALATSGSQQAGSATFGTNSHAALWSGTAASFVDLNPAGAAKSEAAGIWNGYQSGSVWLGTNSTSHAALWAGNAASFTDLHETLGAGYTESAASQVWGDGATLWVAGVATTSSGNQRAMLWTIRVSNKPVILVDGTPVDGGSITKVDSARITLTSNFGQGAGLYYTLDGSQPDFTSWPYSGAFTLSNSASLRVIAYNAAYSQWEESGPVAIQIWPTWPLLAGSPGGGSVTVSPPPYSGTNRFLSNTLVTVTATASNGWSFLRWNGATTATSQVATLLMDQPRTVEAIFGTTLNLFTNGNGHMLLDPPVGPYAYGSAVRLAAVPAAGAYFFGWAGAASGFKNPISIRATNASGITALFASLNATQVSLTVLPSGNGTVTVSPSKKVYATGETVTLTALPATNGSFTSWSGDASGTQNPIQLTLDTSKFVNALFGPGQTTNPPAVTQPPPSRTLGLGQNTTLTFQLTGDGPFAYQWRFNGSPVSGATASVLTLPSFTSAQAGLYSVVVTGPAGTTTSSPPTSVTLFSLETALAGAQTVPLLSLEGAPNTQILLQYCTDLAPTNWNVLAPIILLDGHAYFVDDPFTNHPHRFYRALPH